MNMLSDDSNKNFIQKSIQILGWGGGISLCLHLISWLITGHAFRLLELPLWGAANINTAYPAINFSITATAIAYSLSLYSRMGWFVSIFLLALQGFLFGVLLSFLISDLWKMHLYANLSQIGISAIIESLTLNICLFILVMSSLGYLALPSVRKIFWEE